MASKILNSPEIISNFDISTVRGRLRDKSVEVIKAIVSDSVSREDYKKNLRLLDKGVFYPNEYFKALIEKNQTQRIDYFKKKDSFFHGYTSPKHFKMVSDKETPSGKKVACFVLEKGILPSEALKAIKEGLSLIGCAEVCQIAQYSAIEDVLGTSKFNALFASDSPTPLMIGSTLPDNPISRLRRYLVQENPSESEIKKGDHLFFPNANSYFLKHLNGEAGAYNTLCIDDTIGSQKFITLGFPSEGLSNVQTQDLLIEEYNCDFTKLLSLSEKTRQAFDAFIGSDRISTAEKMKKAQISSEEFKKQGGGKVTIVCELDAKRIAALAKSNFEEARKLLDTYDVRKESRLSTD